MNELKQIWKGLPPIVKGFVLLGGGFLAYRGIKQFLNKPQTITLPQGGSGLPVTGYTPQGTPIVWNPRSLSQELFDAMDGVFTLTGTKEQAFSKVANLPTNDMLTALYNDFNNQFGKGETLTQWIDNEWSDWSDQRTAALAKLRAANLG